jgi:acetone monooxygenase
LRDQELTVCEPTREAEDQWIEHHEHIAAATLVVKTNSWYMGSNVKGKPRRLLSYIGGVGAYRQKCDAVAASGYAGFAMRGAGLSTQIEDIPAPEHPGGISSKTGARQAADVY